MSKLLFQQLFETESSTYTYLLADSATLDAVIVDPVLETADRDLKLINELGLKLLYILETHVHADHVTGAGKIAAVTGAKIAVSAAARVNGVDLELNDGDEKRHNSRLKESIDEQAFVKIMADLKLAEPKKIKIAVPANLNCGRS